jgi:hypothetical protein
MAYSINVRDRAITLRARGYSLKEITSQLGAVKSTVATVVNESKFHPCVHLHEYHSLEMQLDFWSKVTNIDKRQFIRPYIKGHTAKRKREGYQGCISIRYYDADLARRLTATAKAYLGA